MKKPKVKFFALLIALVISLFFSSDFGLVNIEKTAIITAVAIDYENDEYLVTAQVAVPEATASTTENQKAEISGKGSTIGSAIRNIGELSGWFPQMAFCNLIIIGNGMLQTNVIKALDYFTKSLRIQDSAVVILAQKTASELLESSTPLDNISSFAIQKILFKDVGFELAIATIDIKSFCAGYYSRSASSFMPVMKIKDSSGKQNSSGMQDSAQQTSSGASGGGASGGKGKSVYEGSSTALFLHGKKVGELNEEQTLMFNALRKDFKDSTITVNNVTTSNGQTGNYLLTSLRCTPKTRLIANDQGVTLCLSVDMRCRISDQSTPTSDDIYTNTPLPPELKEKAQEQLKTNLLQLVDAEVRTKCDFLGLKDKLYRFNNRYYEKYKDNLLENLDVKISVSINAQR